MNRYPELDKLCGTAKRLLGDDVVIVLFGSRGEGHYDSWSDWDVLIVSEQLDAESSNGLYQSVQDLQIDLLLVTASEYTARLQRWFDHLSGTKPRKSGLSVLGMTAKTLDGVCLSGETQFQSFKELRDKQVQAGWIPEPSFAQFAGIEDGLINAQRILLSALKLRYRKSVNVVVEASNKGTAGTAYLYRLLIKMTQPWVTRYPLIEGQGNFGCLNRMRPSSMRYTECRPSPFLRFGRTDKRIVDAASLRSVIDELTNMLERNGVSPKLVKRSIARAIKDSNDYVTPLFPNLLANGTLGILGCKSRLPPFHLAGVVSALRLATEYPNASNESLLQALGAPDLPTGGILSDLEKIRAALTAGHGVFTVSGRCILKETLDEISGLRTRSIQIVEIPFGVSVEDLYEHLSTAFEQKDLPYVNNLRDLSTWDNPCIDLLLNRDALNRDAQVKELTESLNSMPIMRSTIPIDLTLLDSGKPKRFSLPDLIRIEADRREKVVGSKRGVLDLLDQLRELDIEPPRSATIRNDSDPA